MGGYPKQGYPGFDPHPYERPLLIAHIQTSKGLDTVFWTQRTCLWERDREEPKNEIGKQLYDNGIEIEVSVQTRSGSRPS